MNSKQERTLHTLFHNPVTHSLEFKEIVALFLAIGAKMIEGAGSRVRFIFKNAIAIFHRPHPGKEAKPYQIKDARAFLIQAGVLPT